MNFRRFFRVFWLDFSYAFRRPLLLILMLLLGLTVWGLAAGGVTIGSGDSAVGGNKAWITSEFNNSFIIALLTCLYYGFFVAVGAGMAIIRDEDHNVGPVLHATSLRPGEYVWGKFLSILAAFALVLAFQGLLMAGFFQLLPLENDDLIRGPFELMNYLKPLVVFGFVPVLFIAGVTFALGVFTKRPILVYFFPVALLLFCIFFLWEWSPPGLDTRINRALMLVDPTGFRWLNETQIKNDLGVDVYNLQGVAYDASFVISRVFMALFALGLVWASHLRFRKLLRGQFKVKHTGEIAPATTITANPDPKPLANLSMGHRNAGFFSQLWTISKFEFRNLFASPGMYLFIPLILLQTIPAAYYAPGPFGTWLLATPGGYAALTMNVLTLCVCLLLLFYTAESLHREVTTNLSPIFYSSPVRTGAMLGGKTLANGFVGVVVIASAWLGGAIIMLIQGKVAMDYKPFIIIWGGLLFPTFLFWSALVILVLAITRNKFVTYGVCLGFLIVSGFAQVRGWMNWSINWNLWSAVTWSDIGGLEPNGWALTMNRALYLSATVLLVVISVKIYARRDFDPTRIIHRLYPGSLLKFSLRLAPFAILPLVLGLTLWVSVTQGFQGKKAERIGRDYWRENIATWMDTAIPAIEHADIDLKLEPAESSFTISGSYLLKNIDEEEMRKIALTVGSHTKDHKWTLNDESYEPDDRSFLMVFTPEAPLQQNDTVEIGFEYSGVYPDGITKNGGGMGEFIQESTVVLTGFSPSFAPLVGYNSGIGVKGGENDFEPKKYEDDYYEQEVASAFGSRKPFTASVKVDVPEGYRANSVGVLKNESTQDGRSVYEWETDHPISMFNVVAGRWNVWEGDGTQIYYHPEHNYNIEEMGVAIDASRKYYSEWFYPFPWETLKLSEFTKLATYAQGFPTNITFSEGIGFLTRSDYRGSAAFTITAHEAAHQWWGNILVPGDGPGGNILSEGMAHFSTLLLNEQVKGLQGRIEFAKRIEESYNEDRSVDSERPMVKIDGSKSGDTTVQYDKGGFVFWMLLNHMGRENALAGIQSFIRHYSDNPDHPLLEDFVNHLRPFAPDEAAYDEFTRQWFFDVVLPMYKLNDVEAEESNGVWTVKGTLKNEGNATMPIEIAAASREKRFKDEAEGDAAVAVFAQHEDYRDKRWATTLAPGEEASFEIQCDFEPEVVLVDPDALVMQAKREFAIHRF